MRPNDALSAAIARTNLVSLLERHCSTPGTARLHPERGGVIRDPRPGCEERTPSFSVSQRGGVWLWHRFGRAGAAGRDEGGNAYHLLLSLGFSPRGAAEELLRGANLEPPPHPQPRSQPAPSPARTDGAVSPASRSALHRAQAELERLWPLPALERRGILLELARVGGLGARSDGAILMPILAPDGALRAVKRRRGDLGDPNAPRYRYLDAGCGAPAWCSPRSSGSSGRGSSVVLICEGELNALVAWGALRSLDWTLAVQGVAGASATPELSDLEGRSVVLLGDDDSAGRAGRRRWRQLALEAGARRVVTLEPLPDFLDACDLAGRDGLKGLARALLERFGAARVSPPALGEQSGASEATSSLSRHTPTGTPCWSS